MPSPGPSGKKQFPINKKMSLDWAVAGGSVQQGFIRHEYTANKC